MVERTGLKPVIPGAKPDVVINYYYRPTFFLHVPGERIELSRLTPTAWKAVAFTNFANRGTQKLPYGGFLRFWL